ncbi:hypothetical protein PybrP1_000801 [[Pythium] brassicae (nom. inval.)]|nr:hypothetical protein PybrP1_000801 [[Pythium] brassicae (nom. inval.)]
MKITLKDIALDLRDVGVNRWSVLTGMRMFYEIQGTAKELESVVAKVFTGLVPKRYKFSIEHFDGYKQHDGDSCGVLVSVFFEQYVRAKDDELRQLKHSDVSDLSREDVKRARPPGERLADALRECLQLDRELTVLECSGHARLGAFARPLVTQPQLQQMTGDAGCSMEAAGYDDKCAEPFFRQFFDEEGRSLFEQLLRGRMRVLALAKMIHGRASLAFVRAEVELAEAYARVNLWKQSHVHLAAASELLTQVGAAASLEPPVDLAPGSIGLEHRRQEPPAQQRAGPTHLFLRALEYFYALQARSEGRKGQLSAADVPGLWAACAGDCGEPRQTGAAEATAPFSEACLRAAIGAAQSVHWQQLILHLERQSPRFQAYLARREQAAPEAALRLVRNHFACLDLSQDGIVPFHAFLGRLEALGAGDEYLQALCASLRELLERCQHHSLTWPEVVELGSSRWLIERAVKELWPRQKLLLARLCLRRGQFDDAVRQAQLAIAQHEQLVGPESASLVPFYLVLAEALTVQYKQLGVVAHQAARDGATKWLQSIEGSRALRAKAIDVMDDECARSGAVLPKKVVESRAAEALVHEYAASTLVRPDPAMVEDAVEFCTKAWSIQESHVGRDHVSVAAVHVALAQVYALKGEPAEGIRCYTKAVEICEAACSGPVPASAFLRLEVARLYQQPPLQEPAKACAAYAQIGEFFHSFAHEFAGAESTRRECCAQAIAAFRQCAALLGNDPHTPKDELRRVHEAIFRAASDGYGECSMEASESARDLGALLLDMGNLRAAEKHLRTACYIVESHFGPTDRRYRRLRKDVLDVAAKLRASTLSLGEGAADDDGHAWLTL